VNATLTVVDGRVQAVVTVNECQAANRLGLELACVVGQRERSGHGGADPNRDQLAQCRREPEGHAAGGLWREEDVASGIGAPRVFPAPLIGAPVDAG
jgi:hypothetical protein